MPLPSSRPDLNQGKTQTPRIRVLGGAGIEVDGVPLGGPATHRHRLALVALLLMAAGRSISRDKLMAYLWPERDDEHGRNLLKVAVHEVRKVLGDAAIRTTGDQLSIEPANVRSDLAAFLGAIEREEDEAAVAAYGGPFLDGFFLKEAEEFDMWADGERSRLASMYGTTLDRLASRARAAGDHEIALRWYRMLAAHDPHRTDLALRVMESLAAMGDTAGAIRHLESHAARRRKEFGVEPDADIVGYGAQLLDEAKQNSRRQVSSAASVTQSRPVDFAPYARPATTNPFPAATPSRRNRARWLVAGAVVGAVAAAMAIIAMPRQKSLAEQSPPVDGTGSVVIFPFRMIGSDSSLMALRNGMVDYLSARLTGEGGPRAIDPTTSLSAWKAMSPGGSDVPLDSSLATARALGAGELLLGQVLTAGGGMELTATLYRASDGAIVARSTVEVPAAAQLAQSIDRMAGEVLARRAREPEARLSDISTRPLAALRPYLAARGEYRSGRYARSESLFTRALDADSTFPLAGMGLAMANSWTGVSDNYGRGRDIAFRWKADLSPRDRAFLDAFFGSDPSLGPTKPAPVYLKAWEDVVERWTDWAEASYELGDRYYHFGGLSGLSDPSTPARAAFRRALEIDPDFAAPYHHLIEIYAARGERDELRLLADRYFAANPSVSRDRSAIGWEVATAFGDRAWLGRLRADFGQMSSSDLTRIVWVTEANGWPTADAELAMNAIDRQASVTSAREHALILRYAVATNRRDIAAARVASAAIGSLFPDRPVGALWDMYTALFASEERDAALADSAASRLAPFAASPVTGNHIRRDHHHQAVCLVGYWRALNNDFAAATRYLTQLRRELALDREGDSRPGEICGVWLEATIAVSRRAPTASAQVARLDTVLLSRRVPPHVILEAGALVSSRLHEQLGQVEDALVAARQREHLTGAPIFLATELRTEARLAAAMKDHDGAERARRHYAALRQQPK